MDIRVVDKDGDWYVNSGSFPIVDYGRETTDQIALEPGIMTQIKASKFLADQPTIVKVDSPFAAKADNQPAEKADSQLAEKFPRK